MKYVALKLFIFFIPPVAALVFTQYFYPITDKVALEKKIIAKSNGSKPVTIEQIQEAREIGQGISAA